MTISIIAALTQNRVIGKDNMIPWKLPDDMKYFKFETLGSNVIMGRKNWESIPPKFRPLPERINWVLSRNAEYDAPGATVITSLQDILTCIESSLINDKVYIIGGAEIYKMALPLAQRMYLTEIKTNIGGDVFFPEVDMTEWMELFRTPHPIDEKHQYEFDYVIYERKK